MNWKAGDIAIINCPHSPRHGMECLILGILPNAERENPYTGEVRKGLFYLVSVDGSMLSELGFRLAYLPEELRKRPQQDDQLFTKWFNETILTDCAPSLEETMKTTQANLARYAKEGSK